MELEDVRTCTKNRPQLLALQELQNAVPRVGKAGAGRVHVSGCPCPGMWGRGAEFGVLEHHLLAPSFPQKEPLWAWSLGGGLGPAFGMGRTAEGALLRAGKGCR